MNNYDNYIKEVYKRYIKTIGRIESMIKNSALKNNEELVRMLFKKINLKNIKKS